MARLDHVDLVVSDVERSLRFYRGLLAPLGWRWVHQAEGERGETIHYLFRWRGPPAIGIRERQSGAGHDRYSIGIHHVAFDARTRGAVDRAADWARKHNVEIESGPEEYAYSPGYYAVFLHDPDGIKVEVMSRPRVRTVIYALRPSTTPFRRSNIGRPR